MASTYFMDSPREAERLERKTCAALAERQLRWAGLYAGAWSIDVGCGSGAVTRVMAGICGRALGIDLSEERLAAACRLASAPHFEVARSDALPLADASVDFAWSRFLFEYLPNPERTLHEMARVVRPGGIVAVADLDGQLRSFWPLAPDLAVELDAVLVALRATGFDPDVGRKLPELFQRAGLVDVRVHVEPYQVYLRGVPPDDLHNWEVKLDTTTRWLGATSGDSQRWSRFRGRMSELFVSETTFYYSTMVLVAGRKS